MTVTEENNMERKYRSLLLPPWRGCMRQQCKSQTLLLNALCTQCLTDSPLTRLQTSASETRSFNPKTSQRPSFTRPYSTNPHSVEPQLDTHYGSDWAKDQAEGFYYFYSFYHDFSNPRSLSEHQVLIRCWSLFYSMYCSCCLLLLILCKALWTLTLIWNVLYK